MRRGAVAESIEHITKTDFSFFGWNLENVFEDGLLNIRLMDPNRAAAQFPSIDHNVIVLAAHLFRIGFEHRHVFCDRGREWMMARVPAILFFVETEQRKIHHPKE